jgi:demethoxyubiquinone hydroxylase (CLK1/Coq7/Cat5 family)
LEVGLERGILTLSGILSGSQSYGKETLTILNADSQQQLNYDSEIQRIYEKDNSWREEISDFANDILLNREIATGNSSDALKTMQLITEIYKNGVE